MGLTTRKVMIAAISLVLLLSVVPSRPASASSDQQESAPFGLLFAVLVDARDKEILQDDVTELLTDLFIKYLIAPATGETPGQVRQRLTADDQTAFDLLAAALGDAYQKGSLPGDVSGPLSDLFIEYLTAPATGETPEQVRQRLDADSFIEKRVRSCRPWRMETIHRKLHCSHLPTAPQSATLSIPWLDTYTHRGTRQGDSGLHQGH